MPRVLISSALLQQYADSFRDILEPAGMELVFAASEEALKNPATLIPALQGIDAVLASVEPYSREVLAASRLRVIARHGVGYDSIDVPAATERRIPIVIAPGTNHDSVAEQVMALLFGVLRDVPGRDRSVRAGTWHRVPLPRLAGKTLGIVGLGRIGRAVVPRAIGLGMKVIAHDPFLAAAAVDGVRLVPFDTLLAEADIVSLHLPCTPETTKLINARTLALMKRGSVLLNSSRGGLVDEAALHAALKSGHLFGAGLDVFQTEPPPADNPLFSLPNITLSTHMAGLDTQSTVDMARKAAQGLVDLYQGRWPAGCVVNEELRAGWKW